jgi:hypothetical protein
MTPHSVHYGQAASLRVQRQVTLDSGFAANPNRFKNKPPLLKPMPTAVWIDPPPYEKPTRAAAGTGTLNQCCLVSQSH